MHSTVQPSHSTQLQVRLSNARPALSWRPSSASDCPRHGWRRNGLGGLTSEGIRALFSHLPDSQPELELPLLMALLRPAGSDPALLPPAMGPGQQTSQQIIPQQAPLPQQQQFPSTLTPGGQPLAMDTSGGSSKRPGEDGDAPPTKVLITTAPEDRSWANADHLAFPKPLEAVQWQVPAMGNS